jgi:type IV secretory pathway VirB10-like protein
MTEDRPVEPTAPPPPSAKVDPATLVIRGRPVRAIRFRRGVIISVAALGSASLMAVAWMALKPQVFRHVMAGNELSEPDVKPASDTLNALPASYGDVPKLGPPLPGDLGRPIFKARREMATEDGVGATGHAVDVAQAERQRRAAELKAARESGLMAQLGGQAAGEGQGQGTTPSVPLGQPEMAQEAPRPETAQDRKAAFVATLDKAGDSNPHALAKPASPNMLVAGSVIAASLITGLNSDLPGLVTAQVTQNVYDSVTGQILLIPQGARLIGKYDSVVAFGQKRALVVWQRIILPDGSSVRIDNMPATDPSGYAGIADRIDFHSWALLKGVALSTLLGVGSELTISGESDLVQAIRESTQQNASRAGDQITSRTLDIQPTITIRPGASVRLVVHKDLILAPWRNQEQ